MPRAASVSSGQRKMRRPSRSSRDPAKWPIMAVLEMTASGIYRPARHGGPGPEFPVTRIRTRSAGMIHRTRLQSLFAAMVLLIGMPLEAHATWSVLAVDRATGQIGRAHV